MRKIFAVSILVVATGLASGCGSKDSGNSNPGTTYTMVNGVCTSNTGQVAPATSCPGYANGGYYMNGTTCYNSANQPVAQTYCPINGAQGGYQQGGGYYGYGYTNYPGVIPPMAPPPYYYGQYYYGPQYYGPQGGGVYISYGH